MNRDDMQWAATEAMALAREHPFSHTGGYLNCPLCQLHRARLLLQEPTERMRDE